MGTNASYILVLAALVMMSAYFSATETALSTANQIRLKNMAGGERGCLCPASVRSCYLQYNKPGATGQRLPGFKGKKREKIQNGKFFLNALDRNRVLPV